MCLLQCPCVELYSSFSPPPARWTRTFMVAHVLKLFAQIINRHSSIRSAYLHRVAAPMLAVIHSPAPMHVVHVMRAPSGVHHATMAMVMMVHHGGVVHHHHVRGVHHVHRRHPAEHTERGIFTQFTSRWYLYTQKSPLLCAPPWPSAVPPTLPLKQSQCSSNSQWPFLCIYSCDCQCYHVILFMVFVNRILFDHQHPVQHVQLSIFLVWSVLYHGTWLAVCLFLNQPFTFLQVIRNRIRPRMLV